MLLPSVAPLVKTNPSENASLVDKHRDASLVIHRTKMDIRDRAVADYHSMVTVF